VSLRASRNRGIALRKAITVLSINCKSSAKSKGGDKGAQGNDDALFINSSPGVTFKSGLKQEG
jgi:hypothetical protein